MFGGFKGKHQENHHLGSLKKGQTKIIGLDSPLFSTIVLFKADCRSPWFLGEVF